MQVPGDYYILNNIAVIRLHPYRQRFQAQVEFATARQTVKSAPLSSRGRYSFDFDGTQYDLTIHEYDSDRQQAVVSLEAHEQL